MQPAQQHKGNEGNLYHPASDKVMRGGPKKSDRVLRYSI